MTSDVRNWLYGHDENLLAFAEFKNGVSRGSSHRPKESFVVVL